MELPWLRRARVLGWGGSWSRVVLIYRRAMPKRLRGQLALVISGTYWAGVVGVSLLRIVLLNLTAGLVLDAFSGAPSSSTLLSSPLREAIAHNFISSLPHRRGVGAPVPVNWARGFRSPPSRTRARFLRLQSLAHLWEERTPLRSPRQPLLARPLRLGHHRPPL